jgi:hypothetical protein
MRFWSLHFSGLFVFVTPSETICIERKLLIFYGEKEDGVFFSSHGLHTKALDSTVSY